MSEKSGMRGSLSLALHWQIALALLLALLAGHWARDLPTVLQGFELLGTLFLNALKLLVVPLVVSAIIQGLSSLKTQSLGRLGLLTLLFYAGTGLAAILTGLALVNWLQPGMIEGAAAGQQLGLDASTADVVTQMQSRSSDLGQTLLLLVPPNLFAAAANGQLLGLIGFSLLFGYFITTLPPALAETQRQFWQGFYAVILGITQWVMRFAPLGVFGLVATVVAETGWAALRPLLWFTATVLLGLAVHALVTLPLVLKLVAGRSPFLHYRAMGPALLTAFSTSSSAATLPVTLKCLQDRARIPERVTGFVLPIGANVNTDGTALYECVVVLFIAQAYGVTLTGMEQFVVVLGALLTGLGMAGIPSASLVAITVILSAVGLPLEGIGLVLAVDRVLDMCRTTVNVLGDSCAAATVASLEPTATDPPGNSP